MDTCGSNRHNFSSWKGIETHVLADLVCFTQCRYCDKCGWAEIRDVVGD